MCVFFISCIHEITIQKSQFLKSTYENALISGRLFVAFPPNSLQWKPKCKRRNNNQREEKNLSRTLNPFKWLTVTYLWHFISGICRLSWAKTLRHSLRYSTFLVFSNNTFVCRWFFFFISTLNFFSCFVCQWNCAFGKSILYKMKCTKFSTFEFIVHRFGSFAVMIPVNSFSIKIQKDSMEYTTKSFHIENQGDKMIGLQLNVTISSIEHAIASLLWFDRLRILEILVLDWFSCCMLWCIE